MGKNVHNPQLKPKLLFCTFLWIFVQNDFWHLKRTFGLVVYVIVVTGDLTDGMRA